MQHAQTGTSEHAILTRKDVTEHWVIVGTPAEVWSLQDGVIACAGKPMGYLRSKQKYKNYVLRAEWRFQKEGWTTARERWPNAGFFILASEEVGRGSPEGYICLQSEGWPVFYRKIEIKVLPD